MVGRERVIDSQSSSAYYCICILIMYLIMHGFAYG